MTIYGHITLDSTPLQAQTLLYHLGYLHHSPSGFFTDNTSAAIESYRDDVKATQGSRWRRAAPDPAYRALSRETFEALRATVGEARDDLETMGFPCREDMMINYHIWT